MTPLLQCECTACVHSSLFYHWQAWCSEHFERNQRAGMNELVSPHTQYLYHHFNGYNSTGSLIQNRCPACLRGLLTITCNVNACCQIIINRILFTVFPCLWPVLMCQLSSIQAVQWCFLLQENRILVLACLALLVPIIYNFACTYCTTYQQRASISIILLLTFFCPFNIALMTKCSKQQHWHNSRWMGNFRGSSWPIKNNTTLKTNQNTIRTEYVQLYTNIMKYI